MEINVEGSELVIKRLFSTKRYRLCNKLRIDWGDSQNDYRGAIYYEDKVIYKIKGLRNLFALLFSPFDQWNSYLLAKDYCFEWKSSILADGLEPVGDGYLDVDAYGKEVAELLREKGEQHIREVLGADYELRFKALSCSTHYIAFYDVYKDGVPMCMDDEMDASCLFDGYLKPDEMHLLSVEIVMPLHIDLAQGIYELAYLPKERVGGEYFDHYLGKMKEKGVVSMEKYRYLEEEQSK